MGYYSMDDAKMISESLSRSMNNVNIKYILLAIFLSSLNLYFKYLL